MSSQGYTQQMKYDKTTHIDSIKKSAADQKCNDTPTKGKVCAVAGIRFIRDGLKQAIEKQVAELLAKKPDETGQDVGDYVTVLVSDELNELIKQVSKDGADCGFLSNASAAAKAAGFKTTSATEVELGE